MTLSQDKAMNRLLLGLAGFALAGAAQAQTATAPVLPVIGNVPALCSAGSISGDNTFNLGVLVDTTTGLLRSDLAAAPKTLTAGFCNTHSSINVQATPVTAQSVASAPGGYSRTVNYVATASNWTATPAAFNTASASNPDATQTRATAFAGDIQVALSGFSTGGGAQLRLVSDPVYRGQVTVTLAATN